MCNYSGKRVKCLSVSCDTPSTPTHDTRNLSIGCVYRLSIIHRLFQDNQQIVPQAILAILLLFEHTFYPVSTIPIITTTK